MKKNKKEILVCLNSSNAAANAVELSIKHARAYDAKVHVVTSFTQRSEVKKKDADDMKGADGLLDSVKQKYANEDITCETQLIVNQLNAGENIVNYTQDHNIEEILIGIEKTSRVGKAVFGSTAQYVILNSSCPVVCVR
jgi:nucleotide-binding universal stress UspA family protein